jgi:signal transduction histidine kinase
MPEQESSKQVNREELARRLRKLEESYVRSERISIANSYASAFMHEINNPLEAITNLIYLAMREDSLDEVKRYLHDAQEQLIVLGSIAHSSLTFHKGQEHPKPINVRQIAESALKLHFYRLQRNGIRISTRYADNTGCTGIASELLQVISNLVLNATDALAQTQDAVLTIRVHRTPKNLRFSICDNGPGIPESVEKHIFEAHATGKVTGVGMGLWVSSRIVIKHGGSIRFRTRRAPQRCGTVFSFLLPLFHDATTG